MVCQSLPTRHLERHSSRCVWSSPARRPSWRQRRLALLAFLSGCDVSTLTNILMNRLLPLLWIAFSIQVAIITAMLAELNRGFSAERMKVMTLSLCASERRGANGCRPLWPRGRRGEGGGQPILKRSEATKFREDSTIRPRHKVRRQVTLGLSLRWVFLFLMKILHFWLMWFLQVRSWTGF